MLYTPKKEGYIPYIAKQAGVSFVRIGPPQPADIALSAAQVRTQPPCFHPIACAGLQRTPPSVSCVVVRETVRETPSRRRCGRCETPQTPPTARPLVLSLAARGKATAHWWCGWVGPQGAVESVSKVSETVAEHFLDTAKAMLEVRLGPSRSSYGRDSGTKITPKMGTLQE